MNINVQPNKANKKTTSFHGGLRKNAARYQEDRRHRTIQLHQLQDQADVYTVRNTFTFEDHRLQIDQMQRLQDAASTASVKARSGVLQQSSPHAETAQLMNRNLIIDKSPVLQLQPNNLYKVREIIQREKTDGEGVSPSQNHWSSKFMKYVPVIGPGLEAMNNYRSGDYSNMVFNGSMAIMDMSGMSLFKVAMIGGFPLKYSAEVWKAYLKSKNWNHMRRKLQADGVIVKNKMSTPRADWDTVDHILIKQKKKLSHWLTNFPANLQPQVKLSMNSKFESMGLFKRFRYLPFEYQAGTIGATGSVTMRGVGSERDTIQSED